MSGWYSFIKEARKSSEPFTVILCLPRGRSLNLTIKVWQLRLATYMTVMATIVTPLAIYTSSHLLSQRHAMRQELIHLRNELFAYQVRYDEVYETVYQDGTKPQLSELRVLVDPLESAIAAPSQQEQNEIAKDRSSRPDSIFPDASFPKLALSTETEQNPQELIPIEVALEIIPNGQRSMPRVRLSLQNLAYPQILELRVWLAAQAQSEQAGLVHIGYPSLEAIDWRNGRLTKLDATLPVQIKEKLWQREFEFPEQDQFGSLKWQELRVFISGPDGKEIREYPYQVGQLSANLTTETHLH
ncbi:MAG: hypothetical protein ACOH5I_18655 [Oligoflexus sp.]